MTSVPSDTLPARPAFYFGPSTPVFFDEVLDTYTADVQRVLNEQVTFSSGYGWSDVDPATGIVYLTEDAGSPNGLVYRCVRPTRAPVTAACATGAP